MLAETTQSLREALSSTTARGQWGERMAEDVLRLAGFVDGVNYRKRQAIAGSGGIPDYTFLLPQGLSLHMDVKFPLNNYLRFLDASSDVERERHRKEFLKDVRLRLKEVTSRGYGDTGVEHRRLRAALHPERAGLRVHPGAGPRDPRRRAARQGRVLLTAHAVRGAGGHPPGGRQLPAVADVARDPRAARRLREAVGQVRRADGQGRARPEDAPATRSTSSRAPAGAGSTASSTRSTRCVSARKSMRVIPTSSSRA